MSPSFEKPFQAITGGNRAEASTIRGHFVAASGEFVGTFLFLFFAFSCMRLLGACPDDHGLC